MHIHWFACTEGDGLLVSRTVRFDSGGMRGTCRYACRLEHLPAIILEWV